MVDRREMQVRVNPQTLRFDVGRGGGAPSLTTSDIAAALGMVPASLGGEGWKRFTCPTEPCGIGRSSPRRCWPSSGPSSPVARERWPTRRPSWSSCRPSCRWGGAGCRMRSAAHCSSARRPLSGRAPPRGRVTPTSTSAEWSTPWCRSWPAATGAKSVPALASSTAMAARSTGVQGLSPCRTCAAPQPWAAIDQAIRRDGSRCLNGCLRG